MDKWLVRQLVRFEVAEDIVLDIANGLEDIFPPPSPLLTLLLPLSSSSLWGGGQKISTEEGHGGVLGSKT